MNARNDPPESRSERAATAARDAVSDLDVAIWCAKTPSEIALLRTVAFELIDALTALTDTAITLLPHIEADVRVAAMKRRVQRR